MSALAKRTPLAEIEPFDRRWRRMMESFGMTPFWMSSEAMPAADVFETDGEVVVQVEAPGYEPGEIEVEVHDHQLVVKGERKEEETKEEKTFRLHERLERRFERRFELPAEVDVEHLKAEFAKGVLEIHMPKADQPKPRKIPIGVKP
ncbi:MAG: Hsp20/alpha crystallin family protein [Actinobacteria bacterium]|nr:Hsp20/alpha crystallin family protein [Actinomycetota bacterium]